MVREDKHPVQVAIPSTRTLQEVSPMALREQQVQVALVHDPRQGFLVAFNPKWRRYAFPMRKPRPSDGKPSTTAVRALSEGVGFPLRRGRGRPLDYLGAFGYSGRSNEFTLYSYRVFGINPGQPLP